MSNTIVPLASMDAANLRNIADGIGKNSAEGRYLYSLADTIDAVLDKADDEFEEHQEALRQHYAAGFLEARGWKPNPDSIGHWIDPRAHSSFNGYQTALEREQQREG